MESKNRNFDLAFVCLPSSLNATTYVALVVSRDRNKIVDRREELHDLHAVNAFFKEEYDHDLLVGECYESYFAYRAARRKGGAI
jgi:hypothetical protein